MRAWWRCLPALGCFGCLDVPKEPTIVMPLGTQSTPWRAGPAGAVELEVQPAGETLRIHTRYQRFCTRDTYRTRDVKRPDPAADALVADTVDIMGPLAIPLIFANTSTTTRVTERTMEVRACPLVAPGLQFDVRVPSGAILHMTSDASGFATLPVTGEPAAGQLTLWGNGPTRELRYDLRSSVPIIDPDPCRAQRSFAMMAAHQIKDLKERTRVLLALPVCSTTAISR